jgi:S-adenosylmethionine:tRNA ribosyltransferase-isomerase
LDATEIDLRGRKAVQVGRVLVSDFDYDLPSELIAQEAAPRGASRLLVMGRARGETEHASVADLPRFFRAGDVLVVNDTRVISARLLGHRVPSGGAVECLLLAKPEASGDGSAVVEALMHPGQKLKPGTFVRFEGPAGVLMCEVLEQRYFGRRRIRLTSASGGDASTLADQLGHVPLPPYIRRADTTGDRERYQTVFAQAPGSIAAPTAGLHFSPALIDAIDACRVERVAVTLHIGYGTFKPVRAATVEEHVIDPERYDIDPATAFRVNLAKQEGRRVIAVGTTTTRALEDAARRGGGAVAAGPGDATTFIYPGFEFQVIDGLMTNFHLPRSSLLMLVSAFAGRERVLAAYREAIRRCYRFYSYGDAMLIL